MKKILIITTLFLVPSLVSAATLSLSPSSQSVNVGDTLNVVVNLDTQGTSIDGVDLRYLNYDRNILQAVSVTPGSLMPLTLANTIDTNTGRITFSQVSAGGNKYSGAGALATVNFRALSSGTANVTISHTPQNTTDSNVAANGADVLSSVINGSYAIAGGNSSGGSTSGGGSSSGGGGGGGGGSSSGSAGASSGSNNTYYPSNPSTVATGAAILTRNLFQGLKGDDVLSLQKFLISRGYLTSDNATGFYGAMTIAAVQKFQKAEGIVSSGDPLSTGYGTVGNLTRTKINQYLGSGGSSGPVSGLSATQVAAIKAQITVLQQQVLQLLLKLQALQAQGL